MTNPPKRDQKELSSAWFTDRELARIESTLEGAFRAPRDPDVAVMRMVANMGNAHDDQVRSAFITLLRDENPD